ncbi:MAG: bifunctional 2-polyprenyl-6-hydroxyphenol methylase/3-demethylubiquinol 3-O-methyltransferase UbiG [Moraxella sp.]|uniref:bifunctional 2-polyprenyl-6-hydroxyphenol methylase/3-demethylubiquinol 3-O-methyltransferase UbiG n=1 Tax=Moraxella sp. TaxID=479 RepID=UPI0026DD1F28|nr:bifunctional 2-polyprenyl-6-hydroxyphenol methylase/3-demethylubiquinol 3-O-methyltransferase UbiG [Moraxella sp.]MDO4449591.1 bifunctional 2-polyprenyl-6-hydroxyphenol methylase/3-demethylubiquinol 3-O-methyltransferase UbiG [Moraxella sp.]
MNSTTNHAHTNTTFNNADFDEIGKFTRLADEWWDRQGAFKSLHDINPLRLDWIEDQTYAFFGSKLNGKKVLDVGCGGGILSHSMAVRGADVLGVDLGAENLQAGQIHAKRTGMTDSLAFRCVAIEELAKEQAGTFDVVTCMEMLEHVPDPSAIVRACFELLKPNGVFVASTINRNPKSYLFAIVGAEYVLRLVDKGTHDFHKFITPAELDSMAVGAGFGRFDMTGLHYNPITKRFWLSNANVDVNYMMSFTKGEKP